jgi:hypothetical protein
MQLNLKLDVEIIALKLVINVGSSLNNLEVEIETGTLKLQLIWKTLSLGLLSLRPMIESKLC